MSDEPKQEFGPEDDLPLEGEILDAQRQQEEKDKPEPVHVEARASGTDLEVRPASDQVLMPLDTEQVVKGMEAYQAMLPKLLDANDWQSTGDGKFVKKSGWRKIARAFNLSVMVVSVRIERDAEGNPTRAETIARAMAPNGQVSDADGYCSADESRFKSSKGRQKLENDLRATATTRAKNRAISDLVGMGEVSAEEVDAGAGGGSGWPPADDKQRGILSNALIWLFDGNTTEAEKAWNVLQSALGTDHIPGPVADGVVGVLGACKKFVTAKEEAAKDKPPEGAPPETGDPS